MGYYMSDLLLDGDESLTMEQVGRVLEILGLGDNPRCREVRITVEDHGLHAIVFGARHERSTVEDGNVFGGRWIYVKYGSAVIPPELVEAWWNCKWYEPDDGTDEVRKIQTILREARGGAS